MSVNRRFCHCITKRMETKERSLVNANFLFLNYSSCCIIEIRHAAVVFLPLVVWWQSCRTRTIPNGRFLRVYIKTHDPKTFWASPFQFANDTRNNRRIRLLFDAEALGDNCCTNFSYYTTSFSFGVPLAGGASARHWADNRLIIITPQLSP